MQPLEKSADLETIEGLSRLGVEAVAVCLLWSIVNPSTSSRRATLERHLPGVPFTLSHGSTRPSASIGAPRRSDRCIAEALMSSYLSGLEERLRDQASPAGS